MTTSGSDPDGQEPPRYGERVSPSPGGAKPGGSGYDGPGSSGPGSSGPGYGGPVEPRGPDLPAPRSIDSGARRQASRSLHGPSPVFLGILAVAIASGWALWTEVLPVQLSAFVFVISAWVVTLCLHEFAHAFVAYRNGDLSVVHRGYLTLNPLKYTHVALSIVLPLIFLIAGGIGLPGGAVFIDRSALRSRFANSAVSAAGPLTNAAVALLLGAALVFRDGTSAFWVTLSFLLFLQVTGAVLNLLPVPGLDGFGIVEPYLPRSVLSALAPIAPFAFFGLFLLLWIPQVNAAFFGFILAIVAFLDVPAVFVWAGFDLFQFWL